MSRRDDFMAAGLVQKMEPGRNVSKHGGRLETGLVGTVRSSSQGEFMFSGVRCFGVGANQILCGQGHEGWFEPNSAWCEGGVRKISDEVDWKKRSEVAQRGSWASGRGEV